MVSAGLNIVSVNSECLCDGMKVRKAVGAIIGWRDNPGHVILVKKVKIEDIAKADIEPEWDIPKGGLKDGEAAEQGVWRELAEEVGSTGFVLVRKLPFRIAFDFPSGSRWDRQETALFYLEYSGPSRAFQPETDEIAEARWFPLKEAKRIARYDATIKALEDAEELGLLK